MAVAALLLAGAAALHAQSSTQARRGANLRLRALQMAPGQVVSGGAIQLTVRVSGRDAGNVTRVTAHTAAKGMTNSAPSQLGAGDRGRYSGTVAALTNSSNKRVNARVVVTALLADGRMVSQNVARVRVKPGGGQPGGGSGPPPPPF